MDNNAQVMLVFFHVLAVKAPTRIAATKNAIATKTIIVFISLSV